jgi:transposase-like protein
VLTTVLEGEMDVHLGYSKHDNGEKPTDNRRNGHSKKEVKSRSGAIDLDIPRDRRSDFEPRIVPKYSKSIALIEEQVISLYAKGMTVRDIQDHLIHVYNYEFSIEAISHITNVVMEKAREWQNRPLDTVYPIVFIDGIIFKVRWDGEVKNISVYGMIGINESGEKNCLGLWLFETESSKQWLSVFNEIKARGVKDVLIFCVDGLTGIENTITSAFPDAEVQGCIVHQIRNSLKYVSYKDYKEVVKDLKGIYKAVSEKEALAELDVFEEKWSKKYPQIAKSWKANWLKLSTFFKYPAEVRRLIYTTNPIESFNRALRKVTKNRCSFPNSDSLFKMLYLAMNDATRKWTGQIRNWPAINAQLSVFFEDRLTKQNG